MKRRDLLKSIAGLMFSGTVLGTVEAGELASLSDEEQEELEEILDDMEEEEQTSSSWSSSSPSVARSY